MIGAGKRNKRITIQTVPDTTSAGGEVSEGTPVTFATVFAAIRPLSARENFYMAEQQATTTHEITIPYLAGVTSRMQATFSGRTFYFDNVVDTDEANREMVIMATEIKPGIIPAIKI